MGEWSEYFEDFPEEDSANYVNSKFDPKDAAALRAMEAKRRHGQSKLDTEIRVIVQKHRPPTASKK